MIKLTAQSGKSQELRCFHHARASSFELREQGGAPMNGHVFPTVHIDQRHLYKHFKISERAVEKTSKCTHKDPGKKVETACSKRQKGEMYGTAEIKRSCVKRQQTFKCSHPFQNKE